MTQTLNHYNSIITLGSEFVNHTCAAGLALLRQQDRSRGCCEVRRDTCRLGAETPLQTRNERYNSVRMREFIHVNTRYR